ncbi:MAG: glycoside hydrolase family 95 protein [Verrucomicrobiae bacterium]|nr:glycoside hydrolase family 95 protein [Verrucomicrobiae bacterium]NNJ43363.1 glycoside hydrolase family 95 protein [Akkermansiaceae bacterium]
MPLAQRAAVHPAKGYCSISPAQRWADGIPTGNGVQGATVFGQPWQEQVVINHERLFNPRLEERPLPPRMAGALPEIRRLMRGGKYQEALEHSLTVAKDNGYEGIVHTDRYHPACSMRLETPANGPAEGYLRSLDFMTGEAVVRWQDGTGPWRRSVFVSRRDNVVVQEIHCEGAAFPLSLALELPGGEMRATPEWLVLRKKYDKTARGYEVVCRVIVEGGRSVATANGVEINQATRVLLLTRVEALDDFADSRVEATRRALAALPAVYGDLLAGHELIHRPIMERVSLHLAGTEVSHHATEELLARQKASDSIDPMLLQKMFDMGRFALLSSSGHYPPNLCGIWNGSWKPTWSGDFTLDTNLNIQIAAATVCNMPEALESYWNLIEEIAPSWKVNARHIYGCEGYLTNARTSGREAYLTHFSKWPGHFWTSGCAWLMSPLYEQFTITGDQQFLRERLLPHLEQTVAFYEDFLTDADEDGHWFFAPSYSPENEAQGPSANAVIDIAAAKQAITHLISAYRILEIKPDKAASLERMLERFPPYLINKEGAFKEWARADIDDHYDHRHMSLAYPVWPAHEIRRENAPRLHQAMRVALEKRRPGNHSAHGYVMRAFCAARVEHAELAHGNLLALLRNDYILNGLLTNHNPNHIPNTDMLCALPAVLVETLVDSRPGEIELLPAWSPKLPKGRIRGIQCRTEASIPSLEWDDAKGMVRVTLRSRKDQWIRLICRRGINELRTKAPVREAGADAVSVFLKAGEDLEVEIVGNPRR